MVHGESDHLIVLGGRESRPQGEGGDGETQPSQETGAGQAGPEPTKPTSLRGIAFSQTSGSAEASLTEEPGAGNRTPGSVRGASGNWRPYRDGTRSTSEGKQTLRL